MSSLRSRHPRLYRGFFVSLALALGLAAVAAGRPAEATPRYLACELTDGSTLYIVIANFGGMGGAVRHCIDFWNGRPRGVVQ